MYNDIWENIYLLYFNRLFRRVSNNCVQFQTEFPLLYKLQITSALEKTLAHSRAATIDLKVIVPFGTAAIANKFSGSTCTVNVRFFSTPTIQFVLDILAISPSFNINSSYTFTASIYFSTLRSVSTSVPHTNINFV